MSAGLAQDRFEAQRAWLLRWLFDTALPLWAERGVDVDNGGFFEKLDDAAAPIEIPRRARLVSRQIFVFATAHRMGWNGPCLRIVEHGLEFLLSKMIRPTGMVVPSVFPDGRISRDGFDTYDCAFVLLALAAAARLRDDFSSLRRQAVSIRDRMIECCAHPAKGFHNGWPPTLPLQSNPQMHLLEAFLAWAELCPWDRQWVQLADAMVDLCAERFIDRRTGAVGELFDPDWRPYREEQIVVPGHQFEWAWLLLRWSALRERDDAVALAMRLAHVGEACGVDQRRGIAVNELNRDLSWRDAAGRLWPQAERIKAWHSLAERASSEAIVSGCSERQFPNPVCLAYDRTALAILGLRQFFYEKRCGLWWETIRGDGSCDPDPTRASSLYHIVSAVEELHRTLHGPFSCQAA
jgi:mannose-6-phosphate isomerase